MCSVKMCPFEKDSLAFAKSTGINTAIGAHLRFKGISLFAPFNRDSQDPRSAWCCKQRCYQCAYVGCLSSSRKLQLCAWRAMRAWRASCCICVWMTLYRRWLILCHMLNHTRWIMRSLWMPDGQNVITSPPSPLGPPLAVCSVIMERATFFPESYYRYLHRNPRYIHVIDSICTKKFLITFPPLSWALNERMFDRLGGLNFSRKTFGTLINIVIRRR